MLQKGHPIKWIQQYSLDLLRKTIIVLFFLSISKRVLWLESWKPSHESRNWNESSFGRRESSFKDLLTYRRWYGHHGKLIKTRFRYPGSRGPFSKYNLGKILGLWHPGRGCGKRELQTEKTRLALDLLELNLNLNYASLFTVSLFSLRVLVIKRKQKPRGIYWPPAQGGRGGGRRKQFFIFLSRTPRSLSLASIARSPMFSKRTERKIRQHLCTGLRLPKVDHEIS